MKTPQHLPNPAAEEQASLWAARLDGDRLNDSQRIELDAWLARDPSHRALLSQYCQLSADLEEQVPALVAAGVVALPESAVPSPRKTWWTFPRFGALTFAAAAAVAVTFVVLKPGTPVENVAMAPRERGSHTFADGSRVELNANTSLRFEQNATSRSVTFGGGEALFVVAKDPTRPFIVQTPSGSVRVTGTTFNVRTEATATGFEITVVEGSVQVRPNVDGQPSTDVPLAAGDHFTARADGQKKRKLSESELEDTLAWRRGHIVFNGVPLREAAARYAQYHGRTIQVDAAVAELSVGAQYSIDDLTSFLIGIEKSLGVERHIDPNGAVITLGPRRTP
jgi:transmembrane sensor